MEEDEIKSFTPSTCIYVFLFIYYTIWMWVAYGCIHYCYLFGFDEVYNFHLVDWVNYMLLLISSLYSLYAVIKLLRGDKDCISSIKWALIYSFLCTIINPLRAQIPTHDIATRLFVFLLRPSFYLVFFLYLCLSKGVKKRYPKESRKFGPSGWVWTTIIIGFTSTISFYIYDIHKRELYCKRIVTQGLALANDEICDGFVLFHSKRLWEKYQGKDDTIRIDEDVYLEPTLITENKRSKIILFSGYIIPKTTRTHNYIICRVLCNFSDNMHEMDYKDSTINNHHVISTLFVSGKDSVPTYYRVTTIHESKQIKACVLVSIEDSIMDPHFVDTIAATTEFNLKHILQRPNKINYRNKKYKIGNGVTQNYKNRKPHFARNFFKSDTPRKSFRIVSLQNKKRVEAQ